MPKRTILVVDDSKINRQILQKVLSDEYRVLEAEDGEEALEILRQSYASISAVLLDIVMPVMNGYEVLTRMREDANLSPIPVIVTTGNTEEGAEVKALSLGANDYISKPYNPSVITHRLWNTINLRETAAIVNAETKDELTGLYNRKAFFDAAANMIAAEEPGYYVLSCMDIDNFKVINDQYGSAAGDRVLRHIANVLRTELGALGGISCRINADNFAALYPRSLIDSDNLDRIRHEAAMLDGSIPPVTISTGRYIVEDKDLTVSAMYDRASIAKSAVKGRFDVRIAKYDEAMRESILREHEIINEMNASLESGQFEPWFQPQYNHSSGALIGSEALVRWRHPQRGLIPPSQFIPVFERNGFIYEMDKNIWKQVCQLLRKWIDEGLKPLPVSVNVSRADLFREDFFDTITGFIEHNDIPIDLLRLEITESAFAQSAQHIIDMVKRLIEYGFTVEIDDFGSGYSSLNTLKDVPAHVLKLDMRFLENSENNSRGGNILESIVRMAKWLGMSVIAEGVEEKDQADYLRSIGCFYIQGYLYAKPMPLGEYEKLSSSSGKEWKMTGLETAQALDNNAFWNPKSMETLIFNSYVGGACIFEYYNDKVEMLRVNEKYAKELGNLSIEEALKTNISDHMSEVDRVILRHSIQSAIRSKSESSCEICLRGVKGRDNDLYVRTTLRLIARAGIRMLFYCSIINTTAQRKAEREERVLSEQMQAIMENVNGGVTAVVIKDKKPFFLFANDHYFKQLGYTREQFKTEVPVAFDLVHPDDRAHVIEMTELASAQRKPFTCEYRAIRRDGSIIWLRSNISITALPYINEPVQLSVANDITDQKKADCKSRKAYESLRFLNETAHDLLAHPDPDEGIKIVLEKVRGYFRADRAYVYEWDENSTIARITYEVCASGAVSLMREDKYFPVEGVDYWWNELSGGNVITILDANALDDSRKTERELLVSQNVASLIAVPLNRDGKLIGFFGVDDPHEQQSQVDHLHALGDFIAVILTRRDLNARIKNDKDILDALING